MNTLASAFIGLAHEIFGRTKSNDKAHLKRKPELVEENAVYFPTSLDSSFVRKTSLRTSVWVPTVSFGN